MLNRWCTARRFQRVGHCLFGCQHREDSLEHYAGCPSIRIMGARFLRLQIPPGGGMEYFMLVHRDLQDNARLLKTALLVYAAYRVTERLRQSALQVTPDTAQEMLQQAAREGARGHERALRALDG